MAWAADSTTRGSESRKARRNNGKHRSMPPTCGLTYSQKPFLWTRIHAKTQGFLKADRFLSSDWTRPRGQVNVFNFGELVRLQ
jgi:hypothetical protein